MRSAAHTRFDGVVDEMRGTGLSVVEADVLERHVWSRGEDGFLREDLRFRKTPWARWILSSRYLANDEVVRRLRSASAGELTVADALRDVAQLVGTEASLCSADPRLVVKDDVVRLAARELSDEPLVGDAASEEKFKTHLPLHTLKAVAASEPRGDWGAAAQEQAIATLGWVRVDVAKKLNDRMFVAQVQGESMDDGKSGLVHGGYAIFELWPAGTKQDLIVLARGAFKDPETGSFAVKKYKADKRGAEGTHKSIRLVSLNPDKSRFPDIVLSPERDDDVTVVATLVMPLPAGAIARKARASKATTGRRDTATDAGRRAIATRLQDLAGQLLQATQSAATASGAKAAATSRPPELICLDDHLAVEVGPAPLPPFARQLRILAEHDDLAVLGSNLRTSRRRMRVSPSATDWVWQAPGVDAALLADELAALTVPGLASDRASVFRVDAAGVGRLRRTPTLGPREQWRVVVPPGLPGEGRSLGHGWKIIDVEFESLLDPDLARMLGPWGLEVRPTHPRVTTVGMRPVRWRESASGELVPAYASLSRLGVVVDGMTTLFPGELTAFLATTSLSTHLPLPVGSRWLLEVEEARDGAYCFEATPTRTVSDLERAFFSIEDAEPQLPAATFGLERGDTVQVVGGDGRFVLVESFQKLIDDDGSLAVAGPPLWPVRARLEAPGFRGGSLVEVDVDGRLDVRELLVGWRAAWEGRPFAQLTLDADELGIVTLKHRGQRSVASVIEGLCALVLERAKSLPLLREDIALFDDKWVKPMLHLFGYEVDPLSPADSADAPPGTRAYLLYDWLTYDDGPPKRELIRVCIVVPSSDALEPLFIGAAHAFADKLCARHHARESLVTDGIEWSEHRRGAGLRRPKRWDVVALAREKSSNKLEELLNELAVGV